MEQKQEIFKVKNDVDADNLISEIRDLQADRSRFEMIYKAKMEQVKADFERQTSIIDKEIEFNKSMLQAYFLTVPAKATKTQRTYKLLSGKLVMKNPTTKIAHDDKQILDWAKENASEYIKQESKLDWSKMKENLIIKDDKILTRDGEILEIDGLKLEQVNEQFEIKL